MKKKNYLKALFASMLLWDCHLPSPSLHQCLPAPVPPTCLAMEAVGVG